MGLLSSTESLYKTLENLPSVQHFRRDASSGGLTSAPNSGKTYAKMSRWNVNSSTLAILGVVVFLMLLIVVLPDVDLPDTAFHRGTAPVVVHAQATAAPGTFTVATLFQFPDSDQAARPFHDWGATAVSSDPNFRPILLRSIRR